MLGNIKEFLAEPWNVYDTMGLLIVCSVVLCLMPLAVWLLRRLRYGGVVKYKKSILSGLNLWVPICLLTAIWCLRFGAGLYMNQHPQGDAVVLRWWEEFFNSFLHTLQTFTLDEDYTTYSKVGKDMVLAVLENRWLVEPKAVWIDGYSAYAMALNVLAPVVGGAILLEILSNIFPNLRLRLSFWLVWKEKYYFSELNPFSVELARSIREKNKNWFLRPVMIFTDAYMDDEKERSAELMLEAKILGGICIRDDLSHVPKNRLGRRTFFLIDVAEKGNLIDVAEMRNLKALTDLADMVNRKYLKKAEVYLFVEGDAYIQVEKGVWQTLEEAYAKKPRLKKRVEMRHDQRQRAVNRLRELENQEKRQSPADGDLVRSREAERKDLEFRVDCLDKRLAILERKRVRSMPSIVPVKGYRNLVSNLLVDIPLYEPLVHKEKMRDGKRDLQVAILGTGRIGTEMFLTTYWMGQMLDVRLRIHIVSQETEAQFWNRIDYINPEIKSSMQEESELLRRYNTERNVEHPFAEPYCTVKYHNCDVNTTDFIERLQSAANANNLLDVDYFMVALGSDADNLSAADSLRRYLGQYQMMRQQNKQTVIAYVVYNSALAEALNEKKQEDGHLYMRAVGSMRDVFSCRNVFMTEHANLLHEIADSYEGRKNISAKTGRRKANLRREHRERIRGDYQYWANLARGMHIKYKMFSAGVIDFSVFDSDIEYDEKLRRAVEKYKKRISPEETEGSLEEFRRLQHRLAWLEHRRWNAFTRVKGFRHPGDLQQMLKNNKNRHKQMDLKLHACLVECDEHGIRMDYRKENPRKLDKNTMFDKILEGTPDLLDELSAEIYAIKGQKKDCTDFKYYDYPVEDLVPAKQTLKERIAYQWKVLRQWCAKE